MNETANKLHTVQAAIEASDTPRNLPALRAEAERMLIDGGWANLRSVKIAALQVAQQIHVNGR